jgi:hypothetical protein
MTAYAMINRPALEDFQTPCAIGVKRPQLAPNAFTNPQGAFDAMPEELSERVTRGLDALSDDSARQVHDYLGKRFARDHDLDDEEEGNSGALGERICDLLESANVDPMIVDSVRELLAAGGGGDGTLHITHRSDQDPSGGPSSGYDPMNRSAGAMVGDEPSPFQGAPRVGGGQVPYTSPGDAERHAALENMSRIKSLTPSNIAYKDGVPFTGTMPNGDQYLHGARLRRPAHDTSTHEGRHGSTLAMDAASAEGFFTRFPDARRIRSL